MNPRAFFRLLKSSFAAWNADKATRLGAALAYYSVFSLGPLVMLAIGAASLALGADAAQTKVVDQIRQTAGSAIADSIQPMLAEERDSGNGFMGAAVGLATLLLGAAGVFGQLQDALNTIWRTEPKPGRGVMGFIRDRFLSLTMVLGTGFLLLVSLILTSVLSAVTGSLGGALGMEAALAQIVTQVVTFIVVALLFAMIFRFLPDAQIGWSDVWIGAIITALLFSVGKFALGWYLGRAGVTSGFGAAGSLVLLLLWVYYSSLILLFGAEFTRVYAEQYGSGVKPKPNAQPMQRRRRRGRGSLRSPTISHRTGKFRLRLGWTRRHENSNFPLPLGCGIVSPADRPTFKD